MQNNRNKKNVIVFLISPLPELESVPGNSEMERDAIMNNYYNVIDVLPSLECKICILL